ncbi:MAG: type 4a pilus biogenesis protein PilO [Desulfarculales bacterium]|jgi:hypothetical protein|nr:type 4a pilus biogenesis protein PilO [Desulfarculales bacterium]
MKINHILINPPSPSGPDRPAPSGPGVFNNYLNEALSSSSPQALPLGQSAPPPLRESLSVRPGPIVPGSLEDGCLAQAGSLLGSLEKYQAQLANPRVSLKEAAGSLEKMETEMDSLTSLLEGLPADSQSRQLMEEISALALAQSIKFRRGDYLE